MNQELIVAIVTGFLSVTIMVVLQIWFGQKAENRMACVEQLLQGKDLSPGVTVRVTNLDEGVDDTQLCEEFGRWGNITSAKVHMW